VKEAKAEQREADFIKSDVGAQGGCQGRALGKVSHNRSSLKGKKKGAGRLPGPLLA